MLKEYLKESGSTFQTVGLCKSVVFRASAGRGASYIDLFMVDKSGSFPCKLWGDIRMSREEAVSMDGKVIAFTATTEPHNGGLRFVVHPGDWNYVPDDEICWEEFAWQMPQEQTEDLEGQLFATAERIKDVKLRNLVVTVLENNIAKASKMPAGIEWHHAFNGGLLKHMAEKAAIVVGVIQAAIGVKAGPYRTVIDADIAIAGCLLSDLEKTLEYEPFPKGKKKHEAKMVSETQVFFRREVVPIAKRRHIDEEVMCRLEHVVMSASQNATGAVKPYTLEAFLVRQVDMLSNTLDNFSCLPYLQGYAKQETEVFSKMLGASIEYREWKEDESNE